MNQRSNVLGLIERISVLKNSNVLKDQEELLNEIYKTVDEYNNFIRIMDKRFDEVIAILENKIDGY